MEREEDVAESMKMLESLSPLSPNFSPLFKKKTMGADGSGKKSKIKRKWQLITLLDRGVPHIN